jgi:hypothetical protein
VGRNASDPKLTIPRDARVHPRERLFKALDRASSRKVTWVSAPPGAGKTVLLASWLRARRRRALWITLDEGDDVASLFELLREGARALPGGGRLDLPRFQAEHLPSIGAFARQFFARLGASSRRPDVVVLDDYHSIGTGSTLHRALSEGIGGGAGVPVVVGSRNAPPREYARLRAAGELGALPAGALALTATEARAVARLRGMSAPSAGALALANGWAAGVVLLAASGRRDPDAGASARRSVFEYLAAEVFDDADRPTRDVLLGVSLLPVPDDFQAEKASGVQGAGEVLATLARSGWFVEAIRAGRRPAFRLHALFREFLVGRARDALGAEGFGDLLSRSAALLLDDGDVDGAAELLASQGAWDALANLLARRGPAFAAAGRHESLRRWLDALPAAYGDAVPWIRFWRGVSGFLQDPAAGIAAVEEAHVAFARSRDDQGTWRSWATAIDLRFLALDDFAPIARGLEALPSLLERHAIPDAATEAAVVASALTAFSNVRAGDPDARVWEDRALELALAPGEPRLRMDLGRHLLVGCAYWGTNLARARVLLDALGPIATAPGADPMHALVWHMGASNYHTHLGEAAAGIEVATRGLEIAERSGIHAWDALLLSVRIYGALAEEDYTSAVRDLRTLSRAGSGGRLATCSYHYTAATVSLRRGRLAEAIEHARLAARLAEECSHPLAAGAAWTAWAAAVERSGGGGPSLGAARDACRRSGYVVAEMGCELLSASAALGKGSEDEAAAALARGFAIARRTGALNSVFVSRAALAELCAFALQRGIDPEVAGDVIRVRRLTPGPRARAVAAWPWRVRITTTDGLELLREGREPTGGKAQKKPLELLERLVAAGERGATLGQLADALWPDAEGDVGLHALETAIYRLRRLIGDPDAVVRRGGRVALDGGRVFVEAWTAALIGRG